MTSSLEPSPHLRPLLMPLLQKAGDGAELTPEEAKERLIMTLLLKIKSGTPPQRKSAMRQVCGVPHHPCAPLASSHPLLPATLSAAAAAADH